MTIHPLNPSRRSMLAGGGALILSFSLSRYPTLAQDAPKPAPLPGDLKKAPFLDLDLRRSRWKNHGLHRQSGARSGNKDRVAASRCRRIVSEVRGHRPHHI